jgi:hypothetical protein
MIELGRTREDLLADIDASEDLFAQPEIDPQSPDLCSIPEAHFEVAAHTRDDMLPLLRGVMLRRFDWLPPGQLFHDVLEPLKRGLGNAWKRGNALDPNKLIRAHVALAPLGTLIEIHDEGKGFDVEGVFSRYRENERYFHHGGAGFETLDRSTASVSYANGGRTLMIGYRCPARQLASSLYGSAADERYMRDVLQAQLVPLKKRRGLLETLRIEEPPAPSSPRRRELLYTLDYRDANSGDLVTLVLLGRILPAEQARIDYAVARGLAQVPFRRATVVRIPEVMAAFKGQPEVVFHRFAPEGDLLDLLASRGSDEEKLRAISHVGTGLRRWHRCPLKPTRYESLEATLEVCRDAIVNALQRHGAPRSGEEALVCIEDLARRIPQLIPCKAAPIHGRFGADCVLHESEQLYLYAFEDAHGSHPGLDLGGLLADLRFRESRLHRGFAKRAEEALGQAYGPVDWLGDLSFFVALAALRRAAECIEPRGRADDLEAWLALAREATS